METVFGVEHNVSLAQECARAVLIFFYGLALLRLTGRRTFAHWSALDVLLSIIIGSNLSRALTGSVPLAGTLLASALLVGLHVLCAQGVARYKRLSAIIEGEPVELGRNGSVDLQTRKRHMVSECDLMEALRKKGIEDVGGTKRVVLEASGEITVIKAGA